MTSNEGDSQSRVNPYQAPKSSVEALQTEGLVLASRWLRFFARSIDEIILLAITWYPVSWLVDWLFDTSFANVAYELFWIPYSNIDLLNFVFSFLAYVLLNVYLLATKGQSIGKFCMRIRIVDYYTDEITPLRFSLAMREGIRFAFSLAGMLSFFLITIDALFIFSRNRRCLHDYWAFTKVVKVPEIQQASYG